MLRRLRGRIRVLPGKKEGLHCWVVTLGEILTVASSQSASIHHTDSQMGISFMKIVDVPFESTCMGVRVVDIRYVPGSRSDITISIPRRRAVVPMPEGSRYLGFIFSRAATPAGASLRLAHALLELKTR